MSLLGGSWIVISGVRSPLIWVISIVTLLITLNPAYKPAEDSSDSCTRLQELGGSDGR